ncbi:ABC transporter substrate-binding protein [Miltoncostaea marina]|uniref:ABC transporter substrate-binding protein n=1 Tax=Miltoncostaea marina TaxID=2843215 RepID=UPI001C3C3BA5|nr:ABC transporter substrate-binding protein [Miltoncostaea marina]
MRIVSLLPSATEIVAALGLADALVGRSHECDTPPRVRALPVVSASRIDPAALTGAQIDREVRRAVADGRSLYAVDAAQLEALRPDVVVTQDLCRVCAVSSREVCATGARVVSLDPRSLAGIAESCRALGAELGVPEAGRRLAGEMAARVAAVRRRVAGRPVWRVFVAEWHDPPFAAGHWVPEQVAAAGGHDPLGRPGEPSRATSWDDVLAADPEVVIVAPCGYDRAGAAAEWARACAAGAVPPALAARAVPVDANALFSRPSPAVAAGVEVLAGILHGV